MPTEADIPAAVAKVEASADRLATSLRADVTSDTAKVEADAKAARSAVVADVNTAVTDAKGALSKAVAWVKAHALLLVAISLGLAALSWVI